MEGALLKEIDLGGILLFFGFSYDRIEHQFVKARV